MDLTDANPVLTLALLKSFAGEFVSSLSQSSIPDLFGVTDGKAVGTYVEALFNVEIAKRYVHTAGSAASGIDFPALNVDLKVTSVRQPQSSCPFSSASQKIYSLGYHLLVFVYDKEDDEGLRTSYLRFRHALFIDESRTADFQTTRGVLDILDRNGNADDLVAFLEERNLPLDDIGRRSLAERILVSRPVQGVLTMSNALQWRLQYGRAIGAAGIEPGVQRLLAAQT